MRCRVCDTPTSGAVYCSFGCALTAARKAKIDRTFAHLRRVLYARCVRWPQQRNEKAS